MFQLGCLRSYNIFHVDDVVVVDDLVALVVDDLVAVVVDNLVVVVDDLNDETQTAKV